MISTDWSPDILGKEFKKMTISHGDDYSGNVISTVIRLQTKLFSDKGVLYIHGFSDYFFQDELASEFVSNGYNFYAVDLRKYGRSILPGQKQFEVRDLKEYFPDIDSAIGIMGKDGIKEYTLLGHSTGGLIAALYMHFNRNSPFSSLILNSPFLAWNLPPLQSFFLPLISLIGSIFPDITVRQPEDTRYAQSLRKGLEGEWEYNTCWKPDQMPDVTTGWIHAIHSAQKILRHGADIMIPILLLTSSDSARRNDKMEKFHIADGVLDVHKIKFAARYLGPYVTEIIINNGLHDLALSSKPVRRKYYEAIFSFLSPIYNS